MARNSLRSENLKTIHDIRGHADSFLLSSVPNNASHVLAYLLPHPRLKIAYYLHLHLCSDLSSNAYSRYPEYGDINQVLFYHSNVK